MIPGAPVSTSPLGPQEARRSAGWVYVPLRTAAILSVLVFLTRCALDLFVAHGLYQPQHGLIALLDLALSSWACAEIILVDRKRTPVPLRSLTIAAGVQLAVGVIRGLAVAAMIIPRTANDSLVRGLDLGSAAVFIPIDAALFIVVSKFFIDAFSHTERVRADQLERQITITRQAAADLAAAHRATEAAEARQRQTLRRKLKSSLMASAVAHEIHRPLSTILLRIRLALENGDAGRDTLTALAADARQVVRTIEKMKMLLRVVQSEHVRVDLAGVVQSSLVQFTWQLDQAGIAIQSSGLDSPCFIEGDDVQLQLAVSNVLRNSLESIVATGREVGRIAVALERRKDSATLVIGDDGPGWSGAERDATPLSTTKPLGSGIGLYIVRTVIRSHGGKIAFRHSPLGGAEVRVRFSTLADRDALHTAPAPAGRRRRRANRRTRPLPPRP
jgi:signal transduction histidine kinase